ncbi:MAG: TIGR03905 family TSCPD domain-containing protein [Eubacterium sp.]|nr:TIGR03905 family TSCPD domain-containing protein [Eubacterium sp.]
MHYEYNCTMTCAAKILLDMNDGVVSNVKFVGGCDGNQKGICSLVEGMSVEDIESKLTGITCGRKPTSCPDQLAKAVREAYEASK